ncbi:MAG: hypothetical protein J6X33_01045 [Clostridiales bacterium]|nr:hypothetical protein [Clostridiales bacterium]
MSDFTYVIYILRLLVCPAMAVAILVFGILICVKKRKEAMFIGLWLILQAVTEIVSIVMNVVQFDTPVETFAAAVSYVNICRAILGIASIVILFLHAKILYNSKGIVAVSLLAVMAYTVPRIMVILLFRLGLNDNETMGVSYLANLVEGLFIASCCLITMIAFIKGRYLDKMGIKMFQIPMVLMIIYIVYIGIDSIVASCAFEGRMVTWTVEIIYHILNILLLVMCFVSGIVILAKRKRKYIAPKIVE